MKRLLLLFSLLCFAISCEKEKPFVLDFDQKPEPVVYTEDMKFAYVDRKVCAIHNLYTGNDEWTWTVDDTPALGKYKGYFTTLDEVKPVNNCADLLITSTGGGVALIHIADKSVKFYAFPMGMPHSAEILPDGNIVVACSVTADGNLLKVYRYDALTPFAGEPVCVINNYSGHNVVWDTYNDVLWATADDVINIYSYSLNTCQLKLYDSIKLPSANAHELFPVYGEEKMWLTTSSAVYKFNIYTYECTKVAGRNLINVKSVSSGPKGFPTLTIVPKVSYYTDIVTDITGGEHFTREDGQIYKARWMVNNTFSYPSDK